MHIGMDFILALRGAMEEVQGVVKVRERGQVTIPDRDQGDGGAEERRAAGGALRGRGNSAQQAGETRTLELALKMLGKGLTTSGYASKEQLVKLSREIRKTVHEEWSRR